MNGWSRGIFLWYNLGMKKDLKNILAFIHKAEGEKDALNHVWTSKGRRDSSAEHSWRISVMAILLAPYLKEKVDMERVLKMVAIHDLPKAITGNFLAQVYDYDKKIKDDAQVKKEKATNELLKDLPEKLGTELYDLWKEHEGQKTPEAVFVKALGKIEVRIQHNESDLKTWNENEYPRALFAADKYCQFDETIRLFNELVKEESTQKLEDSGADIEKLKKDAEELKNKQL
ncbi:HD domain-containing protein [candidate division WS5 bacterium]|uniref:HD domain-containing protein n=1 Tax=candidate division WS5 bacterium TaxID=2093353 RepID=A0A419DBS3_9BACT|nr:MAG: HD domain-containing protein [candidate division WS5 bacterium]